MSLIGHTADTLICSWVPKWSTTNSSSKRKCSIAERQFITGSAPYDTIGGTVPNSEDCPTQREPVPSLLWPRVPFHLSSKRARGAHFSTIKQAAYWKAAKQQSYFSHFNIKTTTKCWGPHSPQGTWKYLRLRSHLLVIFVSLGVSSLLTHQGTRVYGCRLFLQYQTMLL